MNVEQRPSGHTDNAPKPVATREVGDGESVTSAVVGAVSSAADAPPRELPPLYDAIDPDALGAIFAPRPEGTPRQFDGCVAFEYAGHEVCVESGGFVRVH